MNLLKSLIFRDLIQVFSMILIFLHSIQGPMFYLYLYSGLKIHILFVYFYFKTLSSSLIYLFNIRV